MHNLTIITPLKEGGVYYKCKLISLPIFLVVKWGQSSPRRSSNSTCAMCTCCLHLWLWVCREQVTSATKTTWGSCTYTVRPWQLPCCGHLDFHGYLQQNLSIAISTPPNNDMAAKSDTERNISCIVVKLPRPSSLGVVSAASRPSSRIVSLLGMAGVDDCS